MTTKLQYLQQQVAAHMAAKEAFLKAVKAIEKYGYGSAGVTDEQRKSYHQFSSERDTAMQLLAAVLPLLQAAVEWDKMDSDIEFDESVMICDALSDKVQKLLEEVEE